MLCASVYSIANPAHHRGVQTCEKGMEMYCEAAKTKDLAGAVARIEQNAASQLIAISYPLIRLITAR